MIRLLLLAAVLIVVSACGSLPLTEGGKNVKVQKSDAEPSCKEIGTVTGSADCTLRGIEKCVEVAKNDLRNKAAEKGANFVRLEQVNGSFHSGTAYKCP